MMPKGGHDVLKMEIGFNIIFILQWNPGSVAAPKEEGKILECLNYMP